MLGSGTGSARAAGERREVEQAETPKAALGTEGTTLA
jgi:hypothetical protein